MGSYYTLYTVFCNSFYVPNIIKIPVLDGFYSLWLKLKKTGLNQFQPVAVLVFDISKLGNHNPLPVACFWVKELDRTRPDQWRLLQFECQQWYMQMISAWITFW